MSHTTPWSAAFELTPEATKPVGEGDDRIRELKVSIRERINLEHWFTPGTSDDWHGVHTPPVTILTDVSLTLAYTHEIVICTSSSSVAILLPAYTSFPTGKRFTVQKYGTGDVTLTRSGSDTINGATTNVISVQYTAVTYVCTGTVAWSAF